MAQKTPGQDICRGYLFVLVFGFERFCASASGAALLDGARSCEDPCPRCDPTKKAALLDGLLFIWLREQALSVFVPVRRA